ncbi:MAG TPA: sialate O-acetylesterase [Sedimentisphaerales bacterium]|jgi:sialate O-acetylesterase|nr:sialate O-acetylesterase [Sedimentisphaerales bacterium]HNU31475.1 sialate O-acetylesterase [Sedimentisphaerales bacterium]
MRSDETASWHLTVLAVCAIAALAATNSHANIRLPAVIGDNMVLQAGDRAHLWGWADPNERIQVAISWRSFTWGIQADDQGRWEFQVIAPNVGGPYQITLKGKNTVTIKNILAGQVWVGSGQSNMQMSVRSSANAEQEIADAKYSKIRLFTVERRVAETPQDDCKGQWVECSPQTVGDFSAVAYFFGRELHNQIKQPIGLIHTSWGGTPAEAWTSQARLEENPNFEPILTRYKQAVADYPQASAKYKEALAQWEEAAAKAKAEGKPAPGGRPNPPMGPGHYQSPTGLYNAMIAPLLGYTIAGAIWYQGESNAGRAYQYRDLFPTMIKCWWDDWGQGDFPFLFVQLANFMETKDQPGDSAWAELREAQLMTLDMPNTGMAVAIDIGDAKDIHPKNKQDVGKRLALWALANTYGHDVVYSGPLYERMEKSDGKIILHFRHCGGQLVAQGGGELKGFAIAGEDRKFVWADARIEGDTVVVSSKEIATPVAVRYAWADNPVCNLFNKAGLPASPFRTDTWPGITVNNK